MPATYLFDLGNTRLKFAPLRADGSIDAAVAAAHARTGDDAPSLAEDWATALPERLEAAFVASVAAPALRVALLDALTARCPWIALARTEARLDTPHGRVSIAYPQPAQLGVDRFLALLGARRRMAHAPDPRLIVGIGTAITLDLLDAAGDHRGGRIAPSPALMRAALHARAAQLPETGGARRAFADNTLDALRSGCDGAALALIDAGLRDAAGLLGATPRLLLHGGGVVALDGLPVEAERAPSLVLEGLAVYAQAVA